mgnify:CR=1 FL=1
MKRHRLLQSRMRYYDITQADIAAGLNKSKTYVATRVRGEHSFCMEDVYAICKMLEIPHEKIHIYFPLSGLDNPKSKLEVVL